MAPPACRVERHRACTPITSRPPPVSNGSPRAGGCGLPAAQPARQNMWRSLSSTKAGIDRNGPAREPTPARLREEATLPIKWITARPKMGATKSARSRLHRWRQHHEKSPCNRVRLGGAIEGGAGRRGGFVIFDAAGGGRGVRDEGQPRAGNAGGALQTAGEVGNGSEAIEVVLPSFESTVRMLLMMACDGDADTTGDFPEEEMIRKAP